MGKVLFSIGDEGPAPTPRTAEDAAAEYFFNRVMGGNFAVRPPVERWRRQDRDRFNAELARLEASQRTGPAT